MTVTELAKTSMVVQAKRISAVALTAQTEVEELALVAERQARERIQKTLGVASGPAAAASGLVDIRITEKQPVISPLLLEEALPLSPQAAQTTRDGRTATGNILTGKDDRLLVITGPCSIHDGDAALEYARQVNRWRQQYGKELEIIMRAYPEKPRTELGWKGLVYDPQLDGSDDINLGLTLTRLIALRITELGVPIAMERLNASTPQYVDGLVSYDAIGARNTTDQKAREYASGTSSPVGFKNTPDGGVEDAASAVVTANNPHTFLGVSKSGMLASVATSGNPLAHIILRGGKSGPNYAAKHIADAKKQLAAKNLLQAIVVDASHGNSGKDPAKQAMVVQDLAAQIASGERSIKGVMLESNLVGGSQKLQSGANLVYGQSITDACIDVPETQKLLDMLSQAVREGRSM